MRNLILTLCVLTLAITACKKKTPVSNVPVIEFKSLNKYQIKEYTDSLQITIAYSDADGDLGENDPNKKNLFLTDSRTNTVLEYRIKEIVPNNKTASIKGTLNVVIDKLYINNASATTEVVIFNAYITDRAGNKSNEVQTGVVTLTR